MKKILIYALACTVLLSVFTGCEDKKEEKILNGDKPVVFFNRQPSDPASGKVDMITMNHNKKTFYVGFDAIKGGEVQGKMIADFLATADPAKIDRNGDGVIGYVLLIGDPEHNDANARTRGVRIALGTWADSTAPGVAKTGEIKVGDKTLKSVELASHAMIAADGATWSVDVAKKTLEEWLVKFGNRIDLIISNNDAMALATLKATGLAQGLPVFGYDANADAIEAIGEGRLAGTVTQNTDSQAAAVLQLLRNLMDGLSEEEALKSGFNKPNRYNNQIKMIDYDPKTRALLAQNTVVDNKNWMIYATGARDSLFKQIDAPKKRVLLSIFDPTNTFLTNSYLPALKRYAPLLNIELTIVFGNGQDDESVLKRLLNLDKFDGFAFNIIKTDSGQRYIESLKD